MFESIGYEQCATFLVSSIQVVSILDLMIHLFELLYQLIFLMPSRLFESFDDRTVDLKYVGFLKVQLLRNLLIEIRKAWVQLLSFEPAFKDQRGSIESLLDFSTCWFLEYVIPEIGIFQDLGWNFFPQFLKIADVFLEVVDSFVFNSNDAPAKRPDAYPCSTQNSHSFTC